jgi:hypothetical protein
MYMRNTLPQLNLHFPMYLYPTRDLYIVIHLSLLYPCAKSILSPVLQFQMIQSHSICVQYIVNGPMLLVCDSTRVTVEQGV